MIRPVGRNPKRQGKGRGAALGILRLRPQAGHENKLRAALKDRLDPKAHEGIISMHLIESDARLSGPTSEIPAAAGAADWFVLLDGTRASAIAPTLAALSSASAQASAQQISLGTYELMWDLVKGDIPQM
jgi:hypothetical protein